MGSCTGPVSDGGAAGAVRLRPVRDADRPLFRSIEDEPAGNAMSNVVARTDEQFAAHWQGVRTDPSVVTRVIEVVHAHEPDGAGRAQREAAGFVTSFITSLAIGGVSADRRCVGYRLAEAWWGRGIATRALLAFLDDVETRRPLWAVTASANLASQRVLSKCGLAVVEERWSEATARYPAGDEVVVRLG